MFKDEIHSFYDGKVQPASNPGKPFKSIDPSTGKPLATVYTSTPEQLEAAVTSAEKALNEWSSKSYKERSEILLKAVAILRAKNDDLARVEMLDTGKAWIETSTVDVATGADVLEYYAHYIAQGLPGKMTRLRDDAYVQTSYSPVGICAGIGAWNYPIQIALWKSAPCLAAGNTMVYKPSEVTPLHANLLAQVYLEAGVPAGVFNVVYGDGITAGAPLVAHPKISKVSFTGQVSTGSKVAASAAAGMKGITMELGGKSPCIILPDADLDDAADTAMMANFYSTGQVCTNGTRVFVPDTLLDKFEQAVKERARSGIRMGLPQDKTTNFGPVVSKIHLDKVNSYIEHGKNVDKAYVLYDGAKEAQSAKPTEGGYWVPPVIFSRCTDDMKIVKEEIFGPVMSILPYSTKDSKWLDSLIDRANDTPMGLAAGIVSTNMGLAQSVIAKIHAGITWINTWGESPPEMPVGGWKMSGVGLENAEEGIKAYLHTKSTLVQLTSGACSGYFAKL